jgi:hypothetical protein
VSWKTLYLSYDFLGFLRNGLTTLELPSLIRLKDGEEEPNIEACQNTFKVGLERESKC